MCASLETLVIAAYVFATTLFDRSPGPEGRVTDPEIALGVAQAVTGLCSDGQFSGHDRPACSGMFPDLPDQSQHNRRLRRLTPYVTTVQLRVAELVASGSVRLVDGTLLACANYAGCASKNLFAGHAAYGYCASQSQRYCGQPASAKPPLPHACPPRGTPETEHR